MHVSLSEYDYNHGYKSVQSCQRTEDVKTGPTRIRSFKPEPELELSQSEPDLNPKSKNITLNFAEILIKKKMSFIHLQSHQLRTAIFILLYDITTRWFDLYETKSISVFDGR